MAEPRVFLRQKWSRYLGELRPIHDIYVGNEIFPSPTPSVTPPVTPTSTPSVTPTNTPSVTQTNTQTNTPSVTQTNTPSNSPTPSITPSITPNPICPEEFVVTNSTSGFFDNGTYIRQYSASGQTMQFGYLFWTGTTRYVVLGTAPDGNNYAIFEYFDGGDYNTVFARFGNALGGNAFNTWTVLEQNPSILTSGATVVGGSWPLGTGSTIFSGVRYPSAGQKTVGYITYPLICPTTTPTPSNTSTPSLTPTNTTTPSQTPTNTPSITPYPVCPSELIISNSVRSELQNGTYTRITNFNGTYSNAGYWRYVQPGDDLIYAGVALDGNSYAVYQRYDGINYYTIVAGFPYPGSGFQFWNVIRQPTDPISNPTTGTSWSFNTSVTISSGGILYPKNGGIAGGYISYPVSCPTPTPTVSVTQTNTPSVTPSNTSTPQVSPTTTPTMTNTQTSTPTNTPSITPTTSLPSCSVNMTVDNNTTGGGVDITGIEINGTPVSYVSGDNFSVLPGEFGTFSTTITGISVTMVVFYDASNQNHAINVTDCDVNSFCCDNLTNGVGSCTFEGLAIDCTCTNGIQIIVNNGDCL